MKVLFVIDTLQGSGAERSLVEIAQNFNKYTPVFVHIYEGDMLVPELKKSGIKVYSLNIPMPRNFALAKKSLEEIYKIEKPDIIHSALFKSDVVTRRLKTKYNIPLIGSYTNNNYNPLRFKEMGFVQGLKLRLVQFYDAYSSRKVDYFISNSETIKKAKAKSTFVSSDKVKVIFRGRNVYKFGMENNEESVKALKVSLDIPADARVLLNVSRLIERKGQKDIIKVLPSVIKEFPNVYLLIAGHGTYHTALAEKAEDLGISKHIKFLGRRQDVPDLLALAEIFVFPSYFEGLPGALIEAMLSRKTIVCSDIPENTECVDPTSAIIFQRGNVEDLSEKLLSALHNKDKFVELGKNARKIAIQKFDIAGVAKEYEKTYDKIISIKSEIGK